MFDQLARQCVAQRMGAPVSKSNALKGIMNHSTDGIHADGHISRCQCPNEHGRVGSLWPLVLNIIRQCPPSGRRQRQNVLPS